MIKITVGFCVLHGLNYKHTEAIAVFIGTYASNNSTCATHTMEAQHTIHIQSCGPSNQYCCPREKKLWQNLRVTTLIFRDVNPNTAIAIPNRCDIWQLTMFAPLGHVLWVLRIWYLAVTVVDVFLDWTISDSCVGMLLHEKGAEKTWYLNCP